MKRRRRLSLRQRGRHWSLAAEVCQVDKQNCVILRKWQPIANMEAYRYVKLMCTYPKLGNAQHLVDFIPFESCTRVHFEVPGKQGPSKLFSVLAFDLRSHGGSSTFASRKRLKGPDFVGAIKHFNPRILLPPETAKTWVDQMYR